MSSWVRPKKDMAMALVSSKKDQGLKHVLPLVCHLLGLKRGTPSDNPFYGQHLRPQRQRWSNVDWLAPMGLSSW